MGGDRKGPLTAGPGFRWQEVTGPVEALVAATVPSPAHRLVRVVHPDDTAFVLGSTQPEPAGPTPYPTVRRRSGGGGVLVVPGQLLWVDIVVPRDDPWWDDDVGRATHPIGQAWCTALGALGLHGEVHRGPLVPSPWSASLCFAGLGPGEVRVRRRKVLGVAQRRTREGACFQCALALVPPDRSSVEAAVAAVARDSGGIDRSPDHLLAALADALGSAPSLLRGSS
jgi:lipoate-protein ligase A